MLAIHDDGLGIDAENYNKIFSLFVRIPKYSNTAIKGYGMGLAIVKQIVKMYQGHVKVKKSELGGACFVWLHCRFMRLNQTYKMNKFFLLLACILVSVNCLAYGNYLDQAIDANGNKNYRLSNSLLHKAIARGESGQQIILYRALNYYQMRQYKLARRLFNQSIEKYNLTPKLL